MNVQEILRELVAIPTPPAISNPPLLDWVELFVEARGWRAERFPYKDEEGVAKANLIARPANAERSESGLGGPIDFAFVCHTDTAQFSLGWVEALELNLGKDRSSLSGSGACDGKGALACFLAALDGLAADTVGSGVALILTADKHLDCKGMERLLTAADLRIRSAIVSEPTSLRPAIAGKGYGLARVIVRGIEAHSAYPLEGLSAIALAARFITLIENMGPRSSAATEESARAVEALFFPRCASLNVSMIQGGSAENRIAGSCSFLVEWRPLPADRPSDVLYELEWLADGLRTDEPRARIRVESLKEQGGFASTGTRALQQRLEQILETPRAPIGICFDSEASRVARIADEVIAMGPGDMHVVREDSECVPLKELQEWTETLRELLVAV
jgi:acetylornithine deacetylase